MRKITNGLAIDLKTLEQIYHPIGLLLRIVRSSAIDVSSPQLDEVFGFEYPEEDLLKILNFDGPIAFMKLKKRTRIFNIYKEDPWSIIFF